MSTALSIRDDAKNIVEDIADDLRMALPSTIPLDRFKATFITAVAHNPEILQCEPQSIKTSLMKAAADNLMPDNREAALVPFNTKVKDSKGNERWVKLAQYMPMVQGIRKRALELGGARITAEVVYENDYFDAVKGDDPYIEHKPAKLGTPRGEPIGAYAIFKDADGNILHREVMDREDVDSTRKVSKAKDGPAWREFWGEMAKKAAVRRGSKSVPSLPDNLRTVIERDDEYADFTQLEKPRTIEHNPLLESKPAVPMDRVDTATGKIIETKSSSSSASPAERAVEEGGGSRRTSTVEAAATNPSRTSPGEGAVEGARGSGFSGPTVDAARTNSSQASSSPPGDDKAAASGTPPTDAAAAKFVFTADEAKKYASWLGRQSDVEKVEKASKHFFDENGRSPEKGGVEHRLFGSIYTRNKDRAVGKIDAAGLLEEIVAEIETIYGLSDFPGDR